MAEMLDGLYSARPATETRVPFYKGQTGPTIQTTYDANTRQVMVRITDGKVSITRAFRDERDAAMYRDGGHWKAEWEAKQDKDWLVEWSPVSSMWTVRTPGNAVFQFRERQEMLDFMELSAKQLVPENPRTKIADKPSEYGGW